MAITTQDQLIAALTGAQVTPYTKISSTSRGAGFFHSLWRVAGNPTAGAIPPVFTAGSGYVPTKDTAGAVPFNNPPTGDSYLGDLQMVGSIAGSVIFFDRLWACSGFNTNTTSTQTVVTPGSLTRPDPNGDGVEIWGEIYAAPGTTVATWTVSYTNESGVSGRSATYTHINPPEVVGQLVRFTLQAGDTGVRSVQSLTCSAASGTAGDLGITLVRRMAFAGFPVPNVNVQRNFVDLVAPRVYDNACIFGVVSCTTTTTGNLLGRISVIQG